MNYHVVIINNYTNHRGFTSVFGILSSKPCHSHRITKGVRQSSIGNSHHFKRDTQRNESLRYHITNFILYVYP